MTHGEFFSAAKPCSHPIVAALFSCIWAPPSGCRALPKTVDTVLPIPSIHTKTWWLMWNKVRPCLVRLNRLLFSSKQERWAKQLSKTKKTSKCEKREVFDWLLAVLWCIHHDLIYTTWLLSLYNPLNWLLSPYNSTCDLHGLYLTIFIYLNS
jgi:hypothetical protein